MKQQILSHEDYLKYQRLEHKNISLSEYIIIKNYSNLPHQEKYKNVILDMGYSEIKKCIPFDLKQIKKALNSGDKHLNTLSLSQWDMASGFIITGFQCSFIGKGLANLYKNIGVTAFSCSQGVCILKEAAKMWAKEG